ncbi:MAG: YdiU family protein, partial [Pseudomonadota bacterium]
MQGKLPGSIALNIPFDNSYAKLPEQLFAHSNPMSVPAPALLAWNASLAEELGLMLQDASADELAQIFSGNRIPDGAEPIALAYAGHQFGHFSPQLGDGRAVLLGEVIDKQGIRKDVQLKGSGRTPFSRGGDGKSSLGPVIREYLLSEAMHTLGVPTTRALAAVLTGERVYRESALPGGVLTRVASSHIRVGSFEYFAARRDIASLKALADYAIARHVPEASKEDRPYLSFFAHVLDVQTTLVAHWMALGFIHGVMNTDNTAISGETLDYGPCAFMDEFNATKVFSSIDRGGRYAFNQQPAIVHWNLVRLAECLLLLDEEQAEYEQQLGRVQPEFESQYYTRMRAKLGLLSEGNEADDSKLVGEWLDHLQSNELDYTLSFRELANQADGNREPRFGAFEKQWKRRLSQQPTSADETVTAMNAVNPLFIPRNHQVERAIQAAIVGDMSIFEDLRKVLVNPFAEQPELSEYSAAPLKQ